MNKTLYLKGKKYISASRAAELTGYAGDYIGQLCRARKITSSLVGRGWYVLESEILDHKNKNLISHKKTLKTRKLKKSKIFRKLNSEGNKDDDKARKEKIETKKISTPDTKVISKSIFPSVSNRTIPNISGIRDVRTTKPLYYKDDNPLFPVLEKKFNTDTIVEVDVKNDDKIDTIKPEKKYGFNFNRVATVTSFICILVILSGLFVSNYFGNKDALLAIFGKNNFASALSSSGWNGLTNLAKDVAYKIVKPWLVKTESILVEKENEQQIVVVNQTTETSSQAKTIFVAGSEREYIDFKIAELKNYFLVNPLAPNVNRYYITRQNDSIVNNINNSILDVSGDLSSFQTSIASSFSTGNLTVTGSTTVADLFSQTYLSVGSTTPGYALSITGSGYFDGGTVTASSFIATSSITTPSLTISGTANLSGVAVNSLLSTNSGGMIIATSTPTFGNFNATSTNATSTIAGGLTVDGSTLTVDYSTSKVGVGTVSPFSKFTLDGGLGTGDVLIKGSSDDSQYSNLFLADNTNPGTVGGHVWSFSHRSALTNPNAFMIWNYNGTDFRNAFNLKENGDVNLGGNYSEATGGGAYLNIVDGNVGIGTINPAYKLSVAGSGFFDGGTVTAFQLIATSSITTPTLTLSGTAINSLLSTNSIGGIVATSTPTFGNFNATSTNATSTIAGGLNIEDGGFVYDYFSGKIGIGTDAPSFKLTVSGSVGPDSDLSYDLGSTALRWNNIYSNAISGGTITPTGFVEGSVVFAGSGGALSQNNTNLFWDNSNQYLNIGTSTALSSLAIQGENDQENIFLVASSTGSSLFLVTKDGKVGIGTTTPSATLSVEGSGYFSGDLLVIGNTSSSMLTVNSSINSDLIPSVNSSYDLGSSSYYWSDAYINDLHVNSISAASTTIAGTNSSSFTINADNATSDIEDVDLIFYRGVVVPNAVISWNSTSDRFEFNQPSYFWNEANSVASTTLEVRANAAQTANILKVSNSSGTSLFNISPAGLAGIGSTTPGYKLSVAGSGFFDGGTVTASALVATSTLDLTLLSQGFAYLGTGGRVNSIASSSIQLSWFNNDAGFTSYAFPFTVNTNYVSTTTTLGLLNGFFSTASSTISGTFQLPSLSNGMLAVYNGLVNSYATTTAGTGLTYSANSFNVNTTQNITKLSNLTSNGFVKTTNSDGTLSIDTTTYQPSGTYITTIGTGYASTTNTYATLSTTTSTTNGITSTITITASNGALTLTPSQTGTLTYLGGGTGISSPTAAGVLLGNYTGTGYIQLATSSLGLTTTNITEGTNQYYTPQKIIDLIHASTTIPKTYTANTFTALQTFNYSSTTYGSFTTASTTNLALGGSTFTTLLGSGLQNTGGALTLNATGNWTGTLDGFDGTTLYQGAVSTSSVPTIGGLAYWTGNATPSTLGTVATGTISVPTGLTITANRYAIGGATAIGLDTGYIIPLSASTTNWNTFYDTPSNRITAGMNLAWNNNILNLSTTTLNLTTSAFASNDISQWNNDSGFTSYAYPFPSAATSTRLTLSGGLDFPYSSSTIYSSFVTASTTNLIVNGQSFNNLLGSGLINSGGALTVQSGVSNLTNYDFTFLNNYGAVNLTPTSTMPIWAQGGINASSTSHFVYASTTAISSTGSAWFATAGGNVGIGTTEPNAKLDVQGGSILVGNNYGLVGTKSNGSRSTVLYAIDSSNNTVLYAPYGNLIFGSGTAGATEKVRIDTNGNVGIGTTSPAGKLDVFVASADASTKPLMIGKGTAGNYVTVLNNGNVGIGNTTPLEKLYVSGNIATNPGSNAYAFKGSAWVGNLGGIGSSGLGLFGTVDGGFYETSDGSIQFVNPVSGVAANTVTFKSGGNVGIGTTSPAGKLDVFVASADASTKPLMIGKGTAGNYVTVLNNGNVGIGTTSPSSKLTVWGSDTEATNLANFVNSASTSVMTILNNGNVGIGTTSPAVALDVKGGFRLQGNQSPTTGAGVEFNYNVTIGTMTVIDRDTSTYKGFLPNALNFQFYTSGSEKLRLSNTGGLSLGNGYAATDPGAGNMIISGNVGIGNTTPLEKLYVSGNIATNPGSNAYAFKGGAWVGNLGGTGSSGLGLFGTVDGGFYETSDGSIQFVNPVSGVAANTVTFKSGGNVGIGTTGPGASLEVYKSVAGGVGPIIRLNNGANAYNDKAEIDFTDGASPTSQRAKIQFRIGASTPDGEMGFFTGTNGSPTERLTIKNAGNVGIGTTSPDGKLTISADTASTPPGQILIRGASSPTKVLRIGYNTTSNYGSIQAMTDGSSYDALVLNPVAGNVGIGTTSPAGKLDVFVASADASTKPLMIGKGTAGNYVTVLNNGNVGIGTTSPAAKLAVNGSVAFPALASDSTGYYLCINTTTGQLASSTTACGGSSIRFKKNINPLTYGIAEIEQLQPVYYDWQESFMPNNPNRQVGFIAEDVAKIIPEIVSFDSEGRPSNVDYGKLTPILVNGIQQQQKQISEVKTAFENYASSTTELLSKNEINIEIINKKIADLENDLVATTTDVESGKLTFLGRVMVYLESFGVKIENGFMKITKLFVGSLHIEGEVCVDDVCVTKEQFKNMLAAAGASSEQPEQPVVNSQENITATTTVENIATSTPPIENNSEATTTDEIISVENGTASSTATSTLGSSIVENPPVVEPTPELAPESVVEISAENETVSDPATSGTGTP